MLPLTPTILRFFAAFLSISRQIPNKGKGLPVTFNAGAHRSIGTAVIIQVRVAIQSHASNSCPAERIAVPMLQETGFVPGAVGTGVENTNSPSL